MKNSHFRPCAAVKLTLFVLRKLCIIVFALASLAVASFSNSEPVKLTVLHTFFDITRI